MGNTTVTRDDLDALIMAARTVQKYRDQVFHYDHERGYHVTIEALTEVLAISGATPRVERRGGLHYPWTAWVDIAGVRFRAVLSEEDLKLIGYHISKGADTPVPIPPATRAV